MVYNKLLSHNFLEFDESHIIQYVSDDDSLHISVMKITIGWETAHVITANTKCRVVTNLFYYTL